jgi:acyl-CoA synthetase (AMP-forming)/AMP-acid ligase II
LDASLRSRPAGWSVTDAIRRHAAERPDSPAVIQGSRTLRFRDLVDRAGRVASGVSHGLGVAKRSRAAIFAPNCLEYVELVLGLSDAACPAVLASSTLTPRDLRLVCNDSEARVLFVHPALEEVARAAELETVERIVVLGEDYEGWLSNARPSRPEARSGDEPFVIRYTSGTIGEPKGAVISLRASVTRFGLHAAAFGIDGPSECTLAVAPLSAGSALTWALTTLLAGGSCVVMPIFHPEAFLRELERRGVTSTPVAPTHVRSVLGMPEDALPRRAPGRLRALAVVAAALRQDERERISAILGNVLHVVYGATETGTIAVLRPEDIHRKPDSVGRPFPGAEVRVVPDGGAETGRGHPGEVHVRCATGFDGYLGRDAETTAAFADGFYVTGDVGLLDEDGYLSLLGRVDDRINAAGVSFHPSEVEEVLLSHPDVDEAVAFAVVDDRLGEAVHAIVVCRGGAGTDERALLAFAAQRLAKERRPRAIELAGELPRTAAGKISRRALRERAEAG